MQNRLAIFLCNLKPAKMRGVESQAMVMCASTPEKVEILIPPAGSVIGDRLFCEGFESNNENANDEGDFFVTLFFFAFRNSRRSAESKKENLGKNST